MNPLTPQQQRAADLLGMGWQQKAVARQAGVSTKTVQRWQHREDFALLVRQARQRVLAENPTAEDTLRAALSATRRDGAPDWQIRVAAARALLGPGAAPRGEDEAEVRTERIYVGEDE